MPNLILPRRSGDLRIPVTKLGPDPRTKGNILFRVERETDVGTSKRALILHVGYEGTASATQFDDYAVPEEDCEGGIADRFAGLAAAIVAEGGR